MPVPPKPTGYVQFSAISVVQGNTQVQAFSYWGGETIVSSGFLSDALDEFDTIWVNDVMPLLSQDIILFGTAARSYTPVDTIEVFAPHSEAGGVASQALPAQNVLELKWHVDRVPGERLVRAKTYISGIAELDSDDGFLTPAATDLWVAAVQNLLDFHPLGDANMDLSMFSPRDGDWQVIQACTVLPNFRVLRRRRTSS